MRTYKTLDPDGPVSLTLLYDRYDDHAERMLNKLIPVYLERAPLGLTDVQTAYAERDFEALWKAAHQLFNTTAALCVPKVERMIKLVENASRSGDETQVDLLLPALVFQHNQLVAYLQETSPA